jgi:YggT family protein
MLLFIHYIFYFYTIMLAVRIIASWFPAAQRQAWLYWLSRCTDPYLNIFRRLIPPIGGVLDLSPLLGFFTLQFLEMGIFKLFQ